MLLCLISSLCIVLCTTVCDITTFGAKGDGTTDNTNAIQNAITACSDKGGTVLVPGKGIFLTYPLTIEKAKGVVLRVAMGGTLRAGDMKHWPTTGSSYIDFITFTDCDNCGLVGDGGGSHGVGGGVVDGQGTPWYIAFDEGKLKKTRPMLVVVSGGVNFKLWGITLLNSPKFNVKLSGVKNAEAGWVNITSDWYENGTKEPHNTDGIDPGGSSDGVYIHDTYIHNGDDSVAVKPGHLPSCTRNILVERCHFERGHGCSIGSVGSGCVENVVFRNITMLDQENGCRIKTYSKGEGYVRNITWADIDIKGTSTCVSVNMNYKTPKATSGTKSYINITDLHLTRVTGSGCKTDAEFICESAMPCKGITLEHMDTTVGSKDPTMHCQDAYGTANDVKPPSCLQH